MGIKLGLTSVDLYFGISTPGNARAADLHIANLFSATRQFRYNKDVTRLSLGLVIFLNELPFATFEFKNSLTKQTCSDAINQNKRDREPKGLLWWSIR